MVIISFEIKFLGILIFGISLIFLLEIIFRILKYSLSIYTFLKKYLFLFLKSENAKFAVALKKLLCDIFLKFSVLNTTF